MSQKQTQARGTLLSSNCNSLITTLHVALFNATNRSSHAVLACSALKPAYREMLRSAADGDGGVACTQPPRQQAATPTGPQPAQQPADQQQPECDTAQASASGKQLIAFVSVADWTVLLLWQVCGPSSAEVKAHAE